MMFFPINAVYFYINCVATLMIALFVIFCNQDRQIPLQQTSLPDDNHKDHDDHSHTQQSHDQGKYV